MLHLKKITTTFTPLLVLLTKRPTLPKRYGANFYVRWQKLRQQLDSRQVFKLLTTFGGDALSLRKRVIDY